MTTSPLNRRRAAAVAAATVLALFAAGCTSGSDQPSSPTGTTTASGNARWRNDIREFCRAWKLRGRRRYRLDVLR